MGVSDVARRTNLLPSDVRRILTSLQYYGCVDQDPETKRYRLVCGLLKLGLIADQRMRLREAGRRLLERISEELDGTALLAMLHRRELEFFPVEHIDCPGETFLKRCLGSPSGPHCTALGKTIMACIDRETTLRAANRSGMPRMTSHTITVMTILEDEFAKIRQQGYGTDHEESLKGACCLAAPVPSKNHRQRKSSRPARLTNRG